ncbi:Peptidyl-tRNA hydrolase [compost metagenome]
MKVIVGLGNPGKQYEETRHNAGFMVIERLAKAWGAEARLESKFEALVAEAHFGGQKVILVEPLTYMNLSGRAIQKVLQFYKLTPDDLLVVYDDFALPLGSIRIRIQGSAGGHNGISSIIQCLGTQIFARLRVGVGPLPPRWSTKDFVLSRFGPAERDDLDQGLNDAVIAVESALTKGYSEAMNRFNVTAKA